MVPPTALPTSSMAAAHQGTLLAAVQTLFKNHRILLYILFYFYFIFILFFFLFIFFLSLFLSSPFFVPRWQQHIKEHYLLLFRLYLKTTVYLFYIIISLFVYFLLLSFFPSFILPSPFLRWQHINEHYILPYSDSV